MRADVRGADGFSPGGIGPAGETMRSHPAFGHSREIFHLHTATTVPTPPYPVGQLFHMLYVAVHKLAAMEFVITHGPPHDVVLVTSGQPE